MDNILSNIDYDFQQCNEIPKESDLTYNNGFYVDVGSIFVDIRGSSKLTESHKCPTLSKLYRAYISEVVSLMNSYKSCKQINIVGDCVSGIFKGTSPKNTCEDIFHLSGQINSLINIFNYKLFKKNICEIKVGIGLDYGSTLMIKAGRKGTGVNDIVWMGDVVNISSKLCDNAYKEDKPRVLMTKKVYETLPWNEWPSCGKPHLYKIKSLENKEIYGRDYFNTWMNEYLENIKE
nr:adenylate/guanylate cyclase domain-containing protein [Methanococcus voltae]